MHKDEQGWTRMNKDEQGWTFWKDARKKTNSNFSLATNIDGSVGDNKIAKMWKCHYKFLLNSAQKDKCKSFVESDINQQRPNYIMITLFNILDVLKNNKYGMAEPIPHEVRPLVRTHVYHPYHAADRQAETDSWV